MLAYLALEVKVSVAPPPRGRGEEAARDPKVKIPRILCSVYRAAISVQFL
jgi:hypothetical protein